MKLSLPSAVTRTASRQALVLSKHSPRILFVAGVVGVAATTVSACKATLRVESILDDHQGQLSVIKGTQSEKYSEKDRKHDVAVLYVKTSMSLVRLYAPAIVLGSLSITALTSSHNILSRRNAGLTAAYAATDKAFREYRERVVGDLGEDKDKEYRYGSEDVTRIVEDKNGPKKEIAKAYSGDKSPSQYARIFGPDNPSWSPTPEYNVARLKIQQNWANDKLRSKGHLLLNDVYDLLEMDRTPAGSQVGWLWDRGNGDNYVDFGCWADENMRGFLDFAMGREDAILLDFNVDGVIWDQI